MKRKSVRLLYGKVGLEIDVPESAAVLQPAPIPAISRPEAAVLEALDRPVDSPALAELIRARRPRTVAITISDITRPVPNRLFLPPLMDYLNRCGIRDEQVVIIIGTGMHRESTDQERRLLVGEDILRRVEVFDHVASAPETLVRVHRDPPVSVNRRFVEADFRIVTGYIEAHFMAGFSGGRKGVCPALVDLETIQRFHGFETLADPRSDNGVLEGNPCHEIALQVARTVGVDFLFNVVLSDDRRIAAICAGDMEQAHLEGCRQVRQWTTASVDQPFDLVVTSGGGYPLDATFYQTIKAMCGALPVLHPASTLLVLSECSEQLGGPEYTELLLRYDNDWRRFLTDIERERHRTLLDQWEYQMQCRILGKVGLDNLFLVSDGIPPDMQKRISVRPVLGPEPAQERAQAALDEYLDRNPKARAAVVPTGPYTMLELRA